MRMLFVSGTTTGGSAASTQELAWALAERGHTVGVLARRRARPRTGLVAPERTGRVHMLASTPMRAWALLRRVTVTTPESSTESRGIFLFTSTAPERVLPAVHRSFRPEVVIVNSVARNPWRSMRAWLQGAGVPVVLYVREMATLEHVPIAENPADLTLANSEALEQAVRRLGLPSSCVPSIIDLDRCEVVSSRSTVLFVNPIASRGLSIAVALAADNPDVRFAFQLSWPLERRDARALRRAVDGHRNIELRTYEPQAARVYRDARVLLLPYLVDQRPRVVAEAQFNGIPVLASDLAGHREAVGSGGLYVPVDAPRDAWSAGLRALLDDATSRRLGAAARLHARRADQDRERNVAKFEALMQAVVSGVTRFDTDPIARLPRCPHV